MVMGSIPGCGSTPSIPQSDNPQSATRIKDYFRRSQPKQQEMPTLETIIILGSMFNLERVIGWSLFPILCRCISLRKIRAFPASHKANPLRPLRRGHCSFQFPTIIFKCHAEVPLVVNYFCICTTRTVRFGWFYIKRIHLTLT